MSGYFQYCSTATRLQTNIQLLNQEEHKTVRTAALDVTAQRSRMTSSVSLKLAWIWKQLQSDLLPDIWIEFSTRVYRVTNMRHCCSRAGHDSGHRFNSKALMTVYTFYYTHVEPFLEAQISSVCPADVPALTGLRRFLLWAAAECLFTVLRNWFLISST